MIWVAGTCAECPMYWTDGHGAGDVGEHGFCAAPAAKRPGFGPKEAAAGRPDWCPLEAGSIQVRESDEGACAPGAAPGSVCACDDCPFFFQTDKRRCNIATPKGRPLLTDEPRPLWCRLRREGVIIRKRAK
ncbi:hypothetical protein DSM19430T_05740 [Desulfovibrio psychrotolerans]|uniref:Uncharacterized protein n=2 Tax=Desulfovibrio psychrotolerans TaxID=415242 RepID=A0A7J0BQE9_9BACT|nr:hypothetical protein DSM19430T_05740 [Desulfovibrio psychrotolerans]